MYAVWLITLNNLILTEAFSKIYSPHVRDSCVFINGNLFIYFNSLRIALGVAVESPEQSEDLQRKTRPNAQIINHEHNNQRYII